MVDASAAAASFTPRSLTKAIGKLPLNQRNPNALWDDAGHIRQSHLSKVSKSMRGVLTNFKVEQYIAKRSRAGKLTWRDQLYRCLNSPSSGPRALMLATVLTFFSLLSPISYAASTVAEWVEAAPLVFMILDILFTSVFTAEVVVRIVVVPRWQHLFDPLVLLPVVCLVPLYTRLLQYWAPVIGWAEDGDTRSILRILDALAPLRLLTIAQYYRDSTLLLTALRRSVTALMVPLSLMLVVAASLGGILYAVESGFPPSKEALGNSNTVKNVPDAIWMMLTTMTTVGFGDFYPNTSVGRVITSIAALSGITIIAMPLQIIGQRFDAEWSGRELMLMVSRLQLLMLERNWGADDLYAVFSTIDDDGNGVIDYMEFKAALHHLDLHLDPKTLRRVWRTLDADREGAVDYLAFCEACFPEKQVDLEEQADEAKSTVTSARQSSRDSHRGPNSDRNSKRHRSMMSGLRSSRTSSAQAEHGTQKPESGQSACPAGAANGASKDLETSAVAPNGGGSGGPNEDHEFQESKSRAFAVAAERRRCSQFPMRRMSTFPVERTQPAGSNLFNAGDAALGKRGQGTSPPLLESISDRLRTLETTLERQTEQQTLIVGLLAKSLKVDVRTMEVRKKRASFSDEQETGTLEKDLIEARSAATAAEASATSAAAESGGSFFGLKA